MMERMTSRRLSGSECPSTSGNIDQADPTHLSDTVADIESAGFPEDHETTTQHSEQKDAISEANNPDPEVLARFTVCRV